MRIPARLLVSAIALLLALGTPPASAAEITEFDLPPRSAPSDIVTGPDGNLWITEQGTGRIARLSPDGRLTEFPLPSPGADPRGMAAG